MSEHDTACTCDRCQMMVMPTSRTASERVLHEWGGERTLRIVQDDFGFRCQVLDRDGDWLPTTAWEDEWLPEFNALAARVAELEAENAKLRKCVEEADAMREEITCPNTGDEEPAENCCDACWSMIHYDAARAEVDK